MLCPSSGSVVGLSYPFDAADQRQQKLQLLKYLPWTQAAAVLGNCSSCARPRPRRDQLPERNLVSMISRLLFDALSALALAITALLGAYIPVFLARRDRLSGRSGRSLIFVLGNLFSAGVMVSAGFCHLLGESLRQMQIKSRFPLPTFLCACGYMLTLVADSLASTASGGHHAHAHGHAHQSNNDLDGTCGGGEAAAVAGVDAERGLVPGCKRLYKDSNQEEQGLLNGVYSDTELTPEKHGSGLSRSSSGIAGGVVAGEGIALTALLPRHLPENQLTRHHHTHSGGQQLEQQWRGLGSRGDASPRCCSPHQGGSHSAPVSPGNGSVHGCNGSGMAAAAGPAGEILYSRASLLGQSNGAAEDTSLTVLVHRPGGHSRSSSPKEPGALGPAAQQQQQHGGGGKGTGYGLSRHVSFITAVLMGVALCFHSLLEGAAMGAQETLSNTLHIFIAIVSHKGLAAYALGSSIVDSEVSMQQFWSVVLPFTFASPVGIFVGYIISDLATGAGAASISALASGTFLYVAFMEVIPKEMRDRSYMVPKLFFLLLGFALMSLLAVWA